VAPRPPPRGVRGLPVERVAHVARRGMAADRHPRLQARHLRPPGASTAGCGRPRRDRAGVDGAQRALRDRDRADQRRGVPHGRSREARGRGLARPGERGQGASRADPEAPAHRRRQAARGRVLGLACGVLDGGDAALRAQGGQGRGPTLQPGGAGPRGARRPRSHADRARGRGRGDLRARDRQRRPRRGAGLARRRGRDLRRAGGAASVRQPPELGRRDLELQPRTGPGRPRRRVAVDGRSRSGRGSPR